MKTIGQRLYHLRTKAGLTKKEVAKIALVSGQTVGKWESDDVIPRDDKIKRISDYFNVTFEWLRVGIDASANQYFTTTIKSLNSESEPLTFDIRHLNGSEARQLVYININQGGDIFPPSSTLIIDINDRKFEENKIYVFSVKDLISVRRLSFTSSGVRLHQLNNESDELLNFQQLDKMKLIGRVICSISPR